tara:strand:- start:154 stop:351 length:198 start_codon:yes stop_codon:yes gene_type:complete
MSFGREGGTKKVRGHTMAGNGEYENALSEMRTTLERVRSGNAQLAEVSDVIAGRDEVQSRYGALF